MKICYQITPLQQSMKAEVPAICNGNQSSDVSHGNGESWGEFHREVASRSWVIKNLSGPEVRWIKVSRWKQSTVLLIHLYETFLLRIAEQYGTKSHLNQQSKDDKLLSREKFFYSSRNARGKSTQTIWIKHNPIISGLPKLKEVRSKPTSRKQVHYLAGES